MRDYGTVKATFWTRGSGKALRGDASAQVLALYLMTCASVNMSGIYYLPMVIMAHETGLALPDTERSLARLGSPEVDLAHYDPVRDLVWVPNLAAHQVGETMKAGDKRRLQVLGELAKHGNHPFVEAFWVRYAVAYHLDPAAAGDRPSDGPLYEREKSTEGVDNGRPLMPASPGDYGHADTDLRKGLPKGHTKALRMGLPMPIERGHAYARGEPAPAPAQEQAPAPAHPETFAPDAPSARPDGPVSARVRQAQAADPKPKGTRQRGRSLMTQDWQPQPGDLERLKNLGLDEPLTVEDFRNYWIQEGKPKADWNATFRNRLIHISRTDWLFEKLKAAPIPVPSGPRPPTNYGPPAPAPPGLVDRLRNFTAMRQPAEPGDPSAAPGSTVVTTKAAKRPDAGTTLGQDASADAGLGQGPTGS